MLPTTKKDLHIFKYALICLMSWNQRVNNDGHNIAWGLMLNSEANHSSKIGKQIN